MLLDEPTNHLDLSMRAAIEIALQSYEGALILISHDRHLLRTTVDDFYLVHQQQVQAFKGDLASYYQWLQTKETAKESKDSTASSQYREKRSLQNRLKKLEQLAEQYQQQMTKFETALTDLSLYQDAQQQTLQALISQRDQVQQQLSVTEEEWLQVMSSLEEFDA